MNGMRFGLMPRVHLGYHSLIFSTSCNWPALHSITHYQNHNMLVGNLIYEQNLLQNTCNQNKFQPQLWYRKRNAAFTMAFYSVNLNRKPKTTFSHFRTRFKLSSVQFIINNALKEGARDLTRGQRASDRG